MRKLRVDYGHATPTPFGVFFWRHSKQFDRPSALKRFTHTRWADASAFTAGVVLPLAYAPYGAAPLAIVALAVLFSTWLGVTPRRALLRGALFGLGSFGFGISWVNISIHQFGGVPLPLSLLLTALLIVYVTLYPALLGYTIARFYRGLSLGSARMALVGVIPAGWALAELLRGWFLTGFPWLSVGYSQTDTPLSGYASMIGVYGVSWMTAVVAGAVAATVLVRGLRQRVIFAAVVVGVLAFGAVLGRVEWTAPAGEPLPVALLQGNMSQDIKWQESLRDPTIDLYANMTRENWDARIIVWPETALPDFYHRQEEFIDALATEAQQHQTDILMGVLYLDREERRYYNTMITVGGERDFYHKRHLVPFTEYLPFKSVLGGLVDFMQVPMSDFSRGAEDKNTLRAAGHDVGMSICFEDVFGEEMRAAIPKASMLVNVSNDAWFGTSAAPHQHLQIARMRAMELQRPLLRATNTGVTAIVDDRGRVTGKAPQFEVAALRGTVQPRDGLTPYAAAGNAPVWVGSVVLLVLARRRLTKAHTHRQPDA